MQLAGTVEGGCKPLILLVEETENNESVDVLH